MAETPPYKVFGYGSLIFKPPPHVIAEEHGYLKGHFRRFAQKSHDHRGTEEYPGRVVTLITKEYWNEVSKTDSNDDPCPGDDFVWGKVFTIDPVYASDVRIYLDEREQDGYSLENVSIYGTRNGVEFVVAHDVSTYVGKSTNPSFAGCEDIDELAHTIWKSVGPSGRNKDYLYNLEDAVKKLDLASHDPYLELLASKVRELDCKNSKKLEHTRGDTVKDTIVDADIRTDATDKT